MCIITLISSDVIHTCVLVCMYMHVHSYTNMVFIVVCVICCRHTVFVSQLLVTITSHAWMLSVSLLIDHATMTWSHVLVVVSQSVYWLTMLQWPGVMSWLLSVSQSTDWSCYNDLESYLGCCQSVYWLVMLQWPGVMSWLLSVSQSTDWSCYNDLESYLGCCQSVSLLIGHATMTWSHILVVVSQSVYWLVML